MADDYVTRWFLVYFDRYEGHTEVVTFDDQDEAFAAYIVAERTDDTKGADPRLEIVLIGADSLDALEQAYPHYFATGTRQERMELVLNSPLFA